MTTAQFSTPKSERAELAEHAESWSTFIFANILWAVLAIPVITLPAATAGLFTFISARARGEQPNLFQTFLGGMRAHWYKAYILALLDVVSGGLIVANTLILGQMDINSDPMAFLARSTTLFAALALLLINLYAWHLLVLLENFTFRQVLVASMRLVFRYPLWSLAILAAALLVVFTSLLMPQGIFVIATASVVTWIVCKGTWRVIRRHLTPVSV